MPSEPRDTKRWLSDTRHLRARVGETPNSPSLRRVAARTFVHVEVGLDPGRNQLQQIAHGTWDRWLSCTRWAVPEATHRNAERPASHQKLQMRQRAGLPRTGQQ